LIDFRPQLWVADWVKTHCYSYQFLGNHWESLGISGNYKEFPGITKNFQDSPGFPGIYRELAGIFPAQALSPFSFPGNPSRPHLIFPRNPRESFLLWQNSLLEIPGHSLYHIFPSRRFLLSFPPIPAHIPLNCDFIPSNS
jgi:hypothetical protein